MSQGSFFEEEPEGPPESVGRKRVLVPYPVDKAYDYAVPEGMALQSGDYVTVPLGNRHVTGVIWGEAEGGVSSKRLKSVIAVHNMPSMSATHRMFIDWLANYTLSARGAVLKMSLLAPKALEPQKPVIGYAVAHPIDKCAGNTGSIGGKNLTDKQRAVVEVLRDNKPRRPSEIAALSGCSAGVVHTLFKKGVLKSVEMYSAPPCRSPDPDYGAFELSSDQGKAVDGILEYMSKVFASSSLLSNGDQGANGSNAHIVASVSEPKDDERAHKALLLDGVTGAGKTEVYFEAVAQALRHDRQILILLPEIALSNAFIDRFKKRFGCIPALWHSNLSQAQRRRTWRGVAHGQTKVVIGARSALLLPYRNLGLIIVDEEHDPAYKQEDGVIYHARDMAVVRAHLGKIPILLVSATPSLETMHNVWEGRYTHVSLPDRFGGARLPDIHTIDLRQDKPERQHFISSTLKMAMAETIRNGDQVLLFLNRRGYAPLTLCRSCGHRMNCPRCSAWLVEHKRTKKLHCHHCGYHTAPPQHCQECEDQDSFAVCGPGVERIHEEVRALFPDARVMVLASDTAENNAQLTSMLQKIRDGHVDIIIGTQIIAKGHHFPNLTCVGVIDADLGLNGGELRGAERVYQLLHQVSGRAGRAQKRGVVYLQSFMPEHRVMRALVSSVASHDSSSLAINAGNRETNHSRDHFLTVEREERQAAHMPPFSRLVGIIVSGRDESSVIEVARALGRCAPQKESIQTFGPAPAPFARLRGRYRYRLLVRSDKAVHIQKTIMFWLSQVNVPSKIRVQVDIDPQSFF